eukprot:CAMPEP_0176402778 /NCGR_PEP_ID=MMETSP0126-20121128/49566_1 /TAXON_ID=141414 ORGANISM="Strombidinopsis acuminatum, Strain SPMC142" /NCGR_SAMPLE_ID=MMETSP0126 /ASSEMBLY_ACC=CAM_ASM_000229 /LENGTH=77 /DNA_ID=CAMNT_0017780631 /DNA_START=1549 /DNA_END=1782 /DNA_ORIENTATION=+
MIRVFCSKMCSCHSANGTTIHTNLAFNFDLFDKELHNTFTIKLGFVRINLLEEMGGRLSIASVVPAQDIAITFEEEV